MATMLQAIKALFIPHKTMKQVTQPGYGDDMRAIEMWANTLKIAVQTAGGGTITDINSFFGSITVTNPTGPTTTLDVEGYPFPPFEDSSANVGYGPQVFSSFVGGAGQSVAMGDEALGNVTFGAENVGLGWSAGLGIVTGNANVAVGWESLLSGDGSDNTAVGSQALTSLSGASNNTAVGQTALRQVTTGAANTAIGAGAGVGIITGSSVTAVGFGAFGTHDQSNMTGLGAGVVGNAPGVVVIGVDHTGAAAGSATTDDFVLGTSNHTIVFPNHSTGAASASLGSNSPATTPGQPAGWIHVRGATGGTLGFIPFWT